MQQRRTQLQPGDWFLRRFRIVRFLNRGGIGEVYEVSYKGKRYALKIIQSQWIDNPTQIRRMIAEGDVLARIKHPYVVEVHESGVTGEGIVWLLMEMIDGRSLREEMNRRGGISIALACAYLRKAAFGVHQCHIFGVVHRDIKPENFMVTRDHQIKLLDFGLIKLGAGTATLDKGPVGTPLYMAPELFNKRLGVSPATDIYGLGIMGYEMLGEEHPFQKNGDELDAWGLFHEHAVTVPEALAERGVPAAISEVIAKALAKAPRDRHQNGLEFAEAIGAAWRKVRDEEPESDTNPGEPHMEQLQVISGAGLPFGSEPLSERRPKVMTKRPSRSSPPGARIEKAITMQLPREMSDPEEMEAFLQRRTAPPSVEASSTLRAGLPFRAPFKQAETVRLPDGLRDPGCVQALTEGAARRHAPAPSPAFVPARMTVPMGVAAAERQVDEDEPPPESVPRSRRWVSIPDPIAAGIVLPADVEGGGQDGDSMPPELGSSRSLAGARPKFPGETPSQGARDRRGPAAVTAAYAIFIAAAVIGILWLWMDLRPPALGSSTPGTAPKPIAAPASAPPPPGTSPAEPAVAAPTSAAVVPSVMTTAPRKPMPPVAGSAPTGPRKPAPSAGRPRSGSEVVDPWGGK